MSLARGTEHEHQVETQPWRLISTGEQEKEHLVKGLFGAEGYHAMLSDSLTVWEERMEGPEIMQRLKVCSLKIWSVASKITMG